MLVFTRSKMFVALLLSLASLPVLAAPTLVASNTNTSVNTQNHVSTITVDVDPNTIGGFDFEMTYDATLLTATTADITVPVGAGVVCQIITAGTVTCFGTDPTDTFDNDLTITVAFDVGATQSAGTPLTFTSSNFSDGNAVAVATNPAPTNGSVVIGLAPPTPPTITFNPNGGNVALTAPVNANQGTQSNVTTIDITAVGGGGGGTGGYNCTGLPANFTVTNPSNASIAAGTDPANMDVSCTLGAAQTSGTLTCTRTGAATTNVVFNVTCPAGVPVPTPVLTATPANGATLSCNGNPGATTTTQVSFQNTGTANVTGLACTVAGAGFTLSTAPAATLAPNATTQAVVTCTVPATEGVTITGTMDCDTTAPGGGPSYTLSSLASSLPVGPTTQLSIPATSLWAKVGLIGLLAAVGVLLVGFRRQS